MTEEHRLLSVCSIFASCDCYHPHCLYKGGLGHACNTVTLADLILNCCVNLVHLKTFESKSELMGLQCTKLSTNYFNLQKKEGNLFIIIGDMDNFSFIVLSLNSHGHNLHCPPKICNCLNLL